MSTGSDDGQAGSARSDWDVDFSSALETRTGKFFIGRDIILDQQDRVGTIHYWRARGAVPPDGSLRSTLALGMMAETRGRAQVGEWIMPRRRRRRRTLHLDPFTAVNVALAAEDSILCHDMGPITHPDLFPAWIGALYRRAFARIAAVRPRVVFVSETSRQEYLRLYGDGVSSAVIYPHLRTELYHGPQAPVAGIDGPFLLTVGSFGRRKNQQATIEAFVRSGLAARGVRFVLCGAREMGAIGVERLAEATPGVVRLPYVGDAELSWLYAQAAGFVLMSRLEGFGMPVAEAIGHGLVPLITGDSVLEEVAGEGAITAPADDVAAIAAGMTALIDLPEGARATRRTALSAAIRRFTRDAFRDGWRAEFARSGEAAR